MSYETRIIKKRLKIKLNEILKTGYFVNCNYHPVLVTEYAFNKYDKDVDGIDCITNHKCSCSLYSCAPEPITKQIAEEMVAYHQQFGDRGLAIKYGGWTEEAYSQFEKDWRS